MNVKGQGTTEYLIILAVIIVIALVVVGVMGWFPGLGQNITEQQSKAYWKSAAPLAITEWDIDSAGSDLSIKNMTVNKIEVEAVTMDGTAVGVTDANIEAGDEATFTGTDVNCATAGEPYSYDVVITYSVKDGLQNIKQTGTKPLVGTCS